MQGYQKYQKCFAVLVLTVMATMVNMGTCGFVFADDFAGQIAVVNGDVRISKNEQDSGRRVQANERFFKGDLIKTGVDGSAKLLFTDQSVMDVLSSSALVIADYSFGGTQPRVGDLHVIRGKVRVLVTKKVEAGGRFRVRTSSATMGVRGTEFLVNTDGETTLSVISGIVSVAPTNGGPAVLINAGQMTAVSRAGVVSQARTANLDGKSAQFKVVDHTYIAAVDLISSQSSGAATSSESRTPASLKSVVEAAEAPIQAPVPPPGTSAQVAAAVGFTAPVLGPSNSSTQTTGSIVRVSLGVR